MNPLTAASSPPARLASLAETHFRVEVPADNLSIIRVSMTLPCYKELLA